MELLSQYLARNQGRKEDRPLLNSLLNNDMRTDRAHSISLLLLIALSWISLLGVIIETAVLTSLDLHIDTTPDPNIDYGNFTLTPPAWTTLSLASIAYLYQLVWLAYATANIFRRCPTAEQRIYVTAGTPSAGLFVPFILTCLLIIVNDVADDRLISCIVNLLIVVVLHIGLVFCYRNHAKYFLSLLLEGLIVDLFLARALVQNGVATLLTWRLMQFYSKLADTWPSELSYKWTLSVVLMHLLIFFILDMTRLRGYVQFTFSPYAVVLYYTIGLVVRYDMTTVASKLALAVLAIDVFFLCVKTLVISWRYNRSCTRSETEIE